MKSCWLRAFALGHTNIHRLNTVDETFEIAILYTLVYFSYFCHE